MAKIRLEIGILLCKQVRNFLDEQIFQGMNIKYYEGEGWVSRTFLIKGEESHVIAIKKTLEKWIEELDE